MEDTEQDELKRLSGWIRAYHKSGLLVTLPVPCPDYPTAFAAVTAALEAGFLVQAPGLEEGERKEDIGWVCRLDHEKDGETTPTVLLYSTNTALTYSYLRRYMNAPEDVQAFEYAAKVKYADLPAYPGNDHPQRGESAKTDRYIVAVPRPFGMIWKPNPKYREAPQGKDTRSLSEKRKRDFVRWADERPKATPENGGAPSLASIMEAWKEKLAENWHLPEFNALLPEFAKLGQEEKKHIWPLLVGWAEQVGWVFDREKKVFGERRSS